MISMEYQFDNKTELYLPDLSPRELALTIGEVEQIQGGEGDKLRPNNIEQFVETPLVEPIRRLFFKNIRTVTSSANKENKEPVIGIDYDCLSPQNKNIAQQMIKSGVGSLSVNYRDQGRSVLFVNMKNNYGDNLPFLRIEEYFLSICNQFKQQPKAVEELRINEVEGAICKQLNFESIEEMREDLSADLIEKFITEEKGKYDWSKNPLVGTKYPKANSG